jgi:ATP-dependent helicase HrpA
VELAVQKDLAWLEKDLRALSRYDSLYAPLGDSAELRETSLEHLKRYVLPAESLPALTRAHFDVAVTGSRRRLVGLASQFTDRLGPVLQLRQQVEQRIGAVFAKVPVAGSQKLSSLSQLGAPSTARPANPLATELANLVPRRFLDQIEYDRLPHIQRYLKALLIRSERAAQNPAKDRERVLKVQPYQDALKKVKGQSSPSPEAQNQLETFRWMIEEFKVSLFAQELGTAIPISPKRLDEQLAIIRQTP